MRSRRPKVLHPLCGRPMIDLVLDACRLAGIEDLTVVISPSQPAVEAHLEGRCRGVQQHEELRASDAVLVRNADSPLIQAETIRRVVEAHSRSRGPATLATVDDASRPDGRIVRRPDGSLDRIVEYKDASEEERAISEINVGLYCL